MNSLTKEVCKGEDQKSQPLLYAFFLHILAFAAAFVAAEAVLGKYI